ncbi:MAG: FtsX-like permease family protein, partial [Betaproteobacteria bacterium]
IYVVNLRLATSSRPSGIADESNVFYVGKRPLQKLSHRDAIAQQQRDSEALAAIPGVQAVSFTSQMPMSRSGNNSGFAIDRKQAKSTASVSMYTSAGPLVKTLGLKLVEGRDFNADDILEIDSDLDDGKRFAKGIIITKPMADLFFPGEATVVGKTVLYGTGNDAIETRIIGVVERLQSTDASAKARGEYSAIIPHRASYTYSMFAVRTEPGQRDRIMAEAESALRKAAPTPMRIRTKTVDQDRLDRYRNEKALAWMLMAVSALLLLVTASGIVGMTTLRVAQRRKLIGVRRALGARRRDILSYFITENVLITSGGVVAGLLLAVLLNQLLVSQLEMSKLPITYLAFGALVLWLLGIVAVYGPAWRAAGISPAIATRSA